jgi:hypothetical protein
MTMTHDQYHRIVCVMQPDCYKVCGAARSLCARTEENNNALNCLAVIFQFKYLLQSILVTDFPLITDLLCT